MTQKEKIIELKNIICKLYSIEGRNISYISKLLEVDRSTLSKQIAEWDIKKNNIKYVNPSTKKFINKNSAHIISQLKNHVSMTEIAKSLNISRDKLYYIISCDETLTSVKEILSNTKVNVKINDGQNRNCFENLPNEIWEKILGFDGYFVSNKGRFKKYLSTYACYALLSCSPNSRNGRLYISLIDNSGKRKNLMAARIVGHVFCGGYSDYNNTVDHLDTDFTNNESCNLQWVPQSINNKRSFKNGKSPVIAYSKNGKFKKILLDNKFEFKTIKAMSNFLNISESQANRYISKECKTSHIIKLFY